MTLMQNEGSELKLKGLKTIKNSKKSSEGHGKGVCLAQRNVLRKKKKLVPVCKDCTLHQLLAV